MKDKIKLLSLISSLCMGAHILRAANAPFRGLYPFTSSCTPHLSIVYLPSTEPTLSQRVPIPLYCPDSGLFPSSVADLISSRFPAQLTALPQFCLILCFLARFTCLFLLTHHLHYWQIYLPKIHIIFLFQILWHFPVAYGIKDNFSYIA